MSKTISKNIVILFKTNSEDTLAACEEIDDYIHFCRTKLYDGFVMVNFASEGVYKNYSFEETMKQVINVLDKYKIIYKFMKLEF